MPAPNEFVKVLRENELGPFIGVPCSILAPLISYIIDNPEEMEYLNPTNEAHALGLAAGFYLGSKKLPVVFMQNSGLGNVFNPLTSLNQIYHIPAFLLVTWRGFGGVGADAPEHDIVGRDLEDYLKILHLPYEILSGNSFAAQIVKLKKIAERDNIPVAAVVKSDYFKGYEQSAEAIKNGLHRYEAIKIIKESLDNYVFLSTTGFTSRESFNVAKSPDFYMLGSMGLISAIGCGAALAQKGKKIAVLDGDGAILMHLGLLPFIGSVRPKHFIHFILDNQSYASTQGQPTVSKNTEFDKIALASGYRQAHKVNSGKELKSILTSLKKTNGPILVWVKLVPGNKEGTERVSITPEEIKNDFMRAMQEDV
jgi:phosphonopyruvate decarboxylase